MSSEEAKLREEAAAKFLSLTSIGKPYTTAEFLNIFADMKKGIEKPLKADLFGDAVGKLGTHAPKIISPRAKISGLTFSLPRKKTPRPDLGIRIRRTWHLRENHMPADRHRWRTWSGKLHRKNGKRMPSYACS